MALPATDDFNRADNAASIGANWTVQVDGFRILSNETLAINGASRQFVFWNADAFGDDQYSQFVIKNDGSGVAGPSVRASATTPNENCYYVFARDSSQGDTHIFKRVAGSDTSLASASLAWAVNDVIKLGVEGVNPGTLTVYKNGVATALTTTDSDLDSGSAGMFSNGGVMFMDDWEGGNVGGAVANHNPLSLLGVG